MVDVEIELFAGDVTIEATEDDAEYAELSSIYPEYAVREAQLKAMA